MSSANPPMFSPLRPTVRALVSVVRLASRMITSSPAVGVAGRVIVKAAPEVSANSLSPSAAV